MLTTASSYRAITERAALPFILSVVSLSYASTDAALAHRRTGCLDSDSCLNALDGWGAYTCSEGRVYCKADGTSDGDSWKAEIEGCCPNTCDLCTASTAPSDAPSSALLADPSNTPSSQSSLRRTSATSSCAATCYKHTCDHWVAEGFACSYLENLALPLSPCDCAGCSCTAAPTAAPAPTAPPTMQSQCGVFVDASVAAAPAGTCGGSISEACASIQQGIDNAEDGAMVCVSEGTYGCAGTVAARVTKSISIQGLGAGPLIDCYGNGYAFDVRGVASEPLASVKIQNFHIENTNGGQAGVWVQDTLSFSILSTAFRNCRGVMAGGVGFEGGGENHFVVMQDLNLQNCHSEDLWSHVSTGCTGLPCPAARCRSEYGYCGSGVSFCNAQSLWNSDCLRSAGAGAISISFTKESQSYIRVATEQVGVSNRYNSNKLSNIYVADCSGGNNFSAGGAGGISIAYTSNVANKYNVNVLENVTVENCEGGGWNEYGGAGGISISYHTYEMGASMDGDYGNMHNSNSFWGLSIVNCVGGSSVDHGTVGGTAGAISVRYSAPNKGKNKYNTNTFDSVVATDCLDVGTGLFGAGAGGISVNFYAHSDISDNVNSFRNMRMTRCKGGIHRPVTTLLPFHGQSEGYLFTKNVYLGGAGAISIAFYITTTQGYIRGNVNSIQNAVVHKCTGGYLTYVAGAGGISISYYGGVISNSHEFRNVSLSLCVGGTDIDIGGGAGGAAIGYHSRWSKTNHNTHTFADVSAIGCSGGDTSQGAGAIGIYVGDTASAFNNSILMNNSTISGNTGGGTASSVHGQGVTGGVAISLTRSAMSSVYISNTDFSRNSLAIGCKGLGTCRAGGLSIFGADTKLQNCTLQSNKSPAQAGALQCTSNIELVDTTFVDNSSPFFGTAILENVSTQNVVFNFSQRLQFGLQARLSPESSYEIVCPVGSEVASLELETQYECTACPQGKFNLSPGTYVNGLSVQGCIGCPSNNSEKVLCSGETISSQPGYFVYDSTLARRATTKYVPQFAACPNSEACKGTYTFDSTHDSSLSLQCGTGYQGMLCTSCLEGFYSPKLDALTCETCPNHSFTLLCDPLVAAVLYLCAVWACLKRSDDDGQEDAHAHSVLSGSFKIWMTHATTLSVVLQVNWAWESNVRHALKFPTAPSGSILDLDVGCLWGWGYSEQVYFDVLYPFSKVLMTVAVFLLVRFFSKHKYGWTVFATTGLYLFAGKSIAFLLISFPCYQAEADARRMVFDPVADCGAHSVLMIVSSIAICVFSMLTVYVLGYSFWQRRETITNPTAFTADDVLDTHVAFGFLFKDYKLQYFWWEWTVIARKFLAIFVAVWFPPTTSMPSRCVLLEVIILVALIVTCASRPHTTSKLNTLDITTQFTSLVSVFLAAYVDSFGYEDMNGDGRKVATVLFLLINLAIFLAHLYICGRPAVVSFGLLATRLRNCVTKEPHGAEELSHNISNSTFQSPPVVERVANPLKVDAGPQTGTCLELNNDKLDIDCVVFCAEPGVADQTSIAHAKPTAAVAAPKINRARTEVLSLNPSIVHV